MKRDICPTHGTVVAVDGDRYCYMCGAELMAKLTHLCGRELCSSDKFCPRCGRPAVAGVLEPVLKRA